MDRHWTLEEAQSALPEAIKRIDEIAAMRLDLVSLVQALNEGDEDHPLGGVAEAKALEAHLDDRMGWFAATGIEVKGIAPALLDFPARTTNGVTLLCWLEGEDTIAFHHDPVVGFAGREPVAEIEWASDED